MLTLGVGIGAATAIFSAASPVLFRALLAFVGGLACWLPACRAARVDLLEAMRAG